MLGMADGAPLRSELLGVILGGGAMAWEWLGCARAAGWSLHVIDYAHRTRRGRSMAGVELHPCDDLEQVLRNLEAFDCRHVTVVGKFRRPGVRNRRGIEASLLRGGDEQVMRGFAELASMRGLRLHDAASLLNPANARQDDAEIIAEIGQFVVRVLGRHRPSSAQEQDIIKAASFLRVMSPFDVGQAVAVAHGRILAIEGAEHTNAMIKRVSKTKRAILVKLAKSGQRFDTPGFGKTTLVTVRQRGFSGVVLGHRGFFCTHLESCIGYADRHRLFLCTVQGTEQQSTGQE